MNDNNERYRRDHAPALPPPVPAQLFQREPLPVVPKPTMKIYRAKDYNGKVIGIVVALSEEIVNAYFVGRGDLPHSTDVLDPNDPRLGVLGLCVLFKTTTRSTNDFSSRVPTDIRVEDQT